MARLWARKPVRIGSVVVLVLAVAAAASVGTYLWTRPSASADPAAAAPTTSSTTVAASTSTIRQTISASGTLTPAVQESVNFAVSGTVASVKVQVGQKVRKGEVLATVGTLALDSDVVSAKASLASAKAKLVSDQNTLTTQQSALATDQTDLATAQDAGETATVTTLTAQISTLQAQITSTKAQIVADKSAVSVAAGQVTTAEQNRAAATLTSPVAGLVTTVGIAVGDAVTGSSSSNGASSGGSSGGSGSGSGGFAGSGSTGNSGSGSQSSSSGSSSSSAAFVIVDTSQWQVNASVSDSQVGLLQVGDQVQISTDTNSTSGTTGGDRFPGGFPGFGGFAGGGFGGFGGGSRGTGTNGSGSNGSNGPASNGSASNGSAGAAPMLFGTISSIGLVSSGSGSTASYPVVVNVTGAQTGLHDGTSVTASIIYRQLTDVLTVPTAAITTSGGTSTVTVVSGTAHTKTPVTTGVSSAGLTQIVSGLSEGDEVLVTTFTRTTTGSGTGAGPTDLEGTSSGRNGRGARSGGNAGSGRQGGN